MSRRQPAAIRAVGAGLCGTPGAFGAGFGDVMSPSDGALPLGASGTGLAPPLTGAGAAPAGAADGAEAGTTPTEVWDFTGVRPPRCRKGLCAGPRGAPLGLTVVRLTTWPAGVLGAGAGGATAASSVEAPPERPR